MTSCAGGAAPDGGEGLAKRKGIIARWGLKEAWSKRRADEQEPDTRRERRTSRQMTAKSISIKGAKRKSGGCARKAVELTSGGLRHVPQSELRRLTRLPDRGAEVSRGQSRYVQ
jgi:hypothetical protein